MSTETSMRDSVDLLVSAVIVAGLHGDKERTNPASTTVVAHADDMGRLLLSAIAIAAASPGDPLPSAVITYEWRPVLEYMGCSLERAHLLQIERTRRYVSALTADVGGWVGANSARLLTALERATAHGLQDAPRAAGDYLGIAEHEPVWARTERRQQAATQHPLP